MATILYFGDRDPKSTAAQRAEALKRLGHHVIQHSPFDTIVNLVGPMGSYRWFVAFHYRTGYRFMQSKVGQWLRDILAATPPPDLIWVDSGELFGVGCLEVLKKTGCPVILYNVDDPTGHRDGRRFDTLLPALSLYDLVVVVRRETEVECQSLGAPQVWRVLRSYDEIAHQPFAAPTAVPEAYRSDVVFIGTWMPHEKRDEFMLELLRQGVPLAIWGSRWDKSPHWKELQAAYRGGALGGRDYVAAIQGAKICLGLLSKGNRDLHTQRSLEVPYAGGLLCAERTEEHQQIFEEGREAVFWADATECARICHELLRNDALRESIQRAGAAKVRQLGVGHEDLGRSVLREFNLS
jgi:spore maturation protein CgeB